MNRVDAVVDAASQQRVPGARAGSARKWPRRKWSRRRVVGLVLGLVLVVGSVGLISAGVLAAVAGSGGTYISLGAHGNYRSDRYGLATDSTNWRTELFGWAGSVRLKIASADGKPIFVGIAPPDAIDRYLAGTGYTTIGDNGLVRTEHEGAAPAIPPATAVRWTAYAEGMGTQTLRWDATDGPQIAFAMNPDGSRMVGVRVVSSAVTLDRMPWWIPAGSLVLGVIALPIGAVMIRRVTASRAGRR